MRTTLCESYFDGRVEAMFSSREKSVRVFAKGLAGDMSALCKQGDIERTMSRVSFRRGVGSMGSGDKNTSH
jgi:hypothetical protein